MKNRVLVLASTLALLVVGLLPSFAADHNQSANCCAQQAACCDAKEDCCLPSAKEQQTGADKKASQAKAGDCCGSGAECCPGPCCG